MRTVDTDLYSIGKATVVCGSNDFGGTVGNAFDNTVFIDGCNRLVGRLPRNALICRRFGGNVCNKLFGSANVKSYVGVNDVNALDSNGGYRNGSIYRFGFYVFQIGIGSRDQVDPDLILAVRGILGHVKYERGQGTVFFIVCLSIPHGGLLV